MRVASPFIDISWRTGKKRGRRVPLLGNRAVSGLHDGNISLDHRSMVMNIISWTCSASDVINRW